MLKNWRWAIFILLKKGGQNILVWNYDYKDIEVDTSRFYDIGATVMSLKFKLSKYLSDFSTQIDKINIESSQKGVSQITLEHKQTEVRV